MFLIFAQSSSRKLILRGPSFKEVAIHLEHRMRLGQRLNWDDLIAFPSSKICPRQFAESVRTLAQQTFDSFSLARNASVALNSSVQESL